ncbi:uncharacterized protein B0I36DRAFT_395004 [Microdochium trichocladiopsis]|uniref:Uncharacterized protein n=1 Tax=Microdochium trichocladiopsis TaxID=1682393 RepID=A0A9P8XUP9_9PEZI|nr:uncharacterized protein B0I36DRAFT_395004 [Microdochium trichocladiopsis]KAH7018251.1 hypothetical protein B0I36DRAFT_395004 [Microdochium trichocladiopsis]
MNPTNQAVPDGPPVSFLQALCLCILGTARENTVAANSPDNIAAMAAFRRKLGIGKESAGTSASAPPEDNVAAASSDDNVADSTNADSPSQASSAPARPLCDISDWEFVSRGSSSVASAARLDEPVLCSSSADDQTVFSNEHKHDGNNKNQNTQSREVMLARWAADNVRQGVFTGQVALALFFTATVQEWLYTSQGQVYFPTKVGITDEGLVTGIVDGLLAWLHKRAQLEGVWSHPSQRAGRSSDEVDFHFSIMYDSKLYR